jgi:hypothetical protein
MGTAAGHEELAMQPQNAAMGWGTAALLTALLFAISAPIGPSRANAQATRDADALANKFAEPEDGGARKKAADLGKDAERRRQAIEHTRQQAELMRRQQELEVYEKQKTEEADMLARAQAEARVHGNASPGLGGENEAQIVAEADRLIADAKSAERDRMAAEAEERRLHALTEQRRLDQARRLIEDQRLAKIEAEQRFAAERQGGALESAREDELNRITDKIRRAQLERAAKAARQITDEPVESGRVQQFGRQPDQVAQGGPEPIPLFGPGVSVLPPRAPVDPSARQVQPAAPRLDARDSILPQRALGRNPTGPGLAPAGASASRATVLLLMHPGDRGIRRFNKSADPVLCMGPRCYISQGPDLDALEMTRARAFGTLNTLGRRAGACSNHLGCVFRNVEFIPSALLQPVDLRVIRHDRREPTEVRLDASCRVDNGRVQCSGAVRASTYVLWAIPEDIAARAGPALLEAALDAGLPSSQTAAVPN